MVKKKTEKLKKLFYYKNKNLGNVVICTNFNPLVENLENMEDK